jgi:hypothetical protein
VWKRTKRRNLRPTNVEKSLLKKAASKVVWVVRTASALFGLALVMVLVFGVATTELAGTGVGARFQLGQTNAVNAVTRLVGSVAGPSLQIDNNSASTDANHNFLTRQYIFNFGVGSREGARVVTSIDRFVDRCK